MPDEPNFLPLPHEWMLISIIGFFVSVFEVYTWSERFGWAAAKSWGIAFAAFFVILFISSIVSMERIGTNEEHMMELAVHHEHVRAGRHRKRA